jgi:hypothetical protein
MKFAILTAEGKKSDRKSNSHNTYELLLLGKNQWRYQIEQQ